MRFRLTIEYDGTAYHGWQLQPGHPSVQGVLEEALSTLDAAPVRVEASGRTDAGVHSKGQVVAFNLDRPLEPWQLERALNAMTPSDIGVHNVRPVAVDFDPRRHARRRAYEYQIWNAVWMSPFQRGRVWHLRSRLDVAAMNEAAAALVGDHDFSSFQAAQCDSDNPNRRVFLSRFEKRGELLVYRIEATAFLRHMVRCIVGTLVEVGNGRRTAASMHPLLQARDRGQAGRTAPAMGLCLMAVDYDD